MLLLDAALANLYIPRRPYSVMKKSQAGAAIYAIVATATVFFLCDLIPDNYKTGLRKMTSDFLSPIFEDQFSPRSRKAGELCMETR